MSQRRRAIQFALLALLTGWATLGHSLATARADRWIDQRAFDTFVCHADFDLRHHLRLLAGLTQLRGDLHDELQLNDSSQTIEVYLFRDRDRYRDYWKERFPTIDPRRAMFVKGRGRGMVFAYRNRELEVDLRHECTHAILHASLSDIPLWLDEGLAEYFEMPPASRDSGHPHLAALVESLSSPAEVPHPAMLTRKQDLAEMGLEDYRFAWAWVHFLLHGPPEAKEELVGFLEDLADGRSADPLGSRLNRRLPDLPARLWQHLHQWAE